MVDNTQNRRDGYFNQYWHQRKNGRPSMRRGLIIAGVCLFVGLAISAVRAEEIKWQTDLNQAWRQARAEGRPLLMFVVRDGCTYCEQMKAKTYANSQLASEINETYVTLMVKPKQGTRFARDFKIQGYPTTLVISPQSKVLDRIKGYLPPQKLRQHLNAAENRLNATANRPRTKR